MGTANQDFVTVARQRDALADQLQMAHAHLKVLQHRVDELESDRECWKRTAEMLCQGRDEWYRRFVEAASVYPDPRSKDSA